MEHHKLPFIDWSLVNVLARNQDCGERSDVSLDLSLSLGNSSSPSSSKPSDNDTPIPTQTSTTDHKEKQAIICMEKNGNALSDSDTDDDISLELSLSLNNHKRKKQTGSTCMEKSGCALSSGSTNDDDLSLSLSLSMNSGSEGSNLKPKDVFTSKKAGKSMGSTPGNRKSKRSRVEPVRLAANDPWFIKKKLYKSDLGDNARLLLASSSVEAHVFPHWNENQLALIETKDGLPVSVWDRDIESVHGMKFKRWSNGANVLIGNWVPEFVKRRQLMQGDEIGLYWDIQNSRFVFSVLSRAPRQQQQ